MVKKIGFILLFISCLSFLSIIIIPLFEFSKSQIAGIITILIIAGELLFYLSIIILGKSYYAKIKNRLKFWKKQVNESD